MDKAKKITRKIFFKEINISCRIGVYEHEKKHPQRIIISIEFELTTEVEPINDKIDETLNYDLIYSHLVFYFLKFYKFQLINYKLYHFVQILKKSIKYQ